MPNLPYRRRWWALAILSVSVIVIGMDLLILNVALPTLVRDLHATPSQLQWMVDAYVVAAAGLLLTMGALGDRFGRKRLLDLGLLVLVAASVTAAWAQSPEMLIAARAALGVGSAMIMPATLSIVIAIFPPDERSRAIGVWAAMAGIGLVVGPAVGGWLLDNFWWGSVFLVNVPVAGVALAAGLLLIPESRDPAATPLDPLGAVLSVSGLSALVYAIIEAPDAGWTDPGIIGMFGLGAVLLTWFLGWQLRSRHPMLQLDFFRNARFSAASAVLMLAMFAMFGTIFLITQYLQFVLGYTALQTGWRVMPVATLTIGALLATWLTVRVGTKLVVTAGLVIVAAGLWRISIVALGVAVLGSVLSSSYQDRITPALHLQPDQIADSAQDSIGAALAIANRLGPAGTELALAARTAFTEAMNDAVLVAAAVALLGALVALAFLPAQPRNAPAPPAPPAPEEVPDRLRG